MIDMPFNKEMWMCRLAAGMGGWSKINANWVIWVRGSDVARPETPHEPKGNITDDPSRCINEGV